jgi:G3E family GTPase
LPNGCLCCRSRQDLADALTKVWTASEGGLDGVLLEMSGLSEVQQGNCDCIVQRDMYVTYVCVHWEMAD